MAQRIGTVKNQKEKKWKNTFKLGLYIYIYIYIHTGFVRVVLYAPTSNGITVFWGIFYYQWTMGSARKQGK